MTDYIRQLTAPRFPYEANESSRLVKAFDVDTSVAEGVVRWLSNGSVPPRDVMELWRHVGKAFDFEKSESVRRAELAVFIDDYARRFRHSPPSAEEQSELKAAFGAGSTVVDVISGRITKL